MSPRGWTASKKGRRSDDDDEGDEPDDEGNAKNLAADDAGLRRAGLRRRTALERADSAEMDWRHEGLFYDFQARADAVAGLFGIGHHAPKPMAGETLRNYKVRCLRPWQKLSPAYKDVDLKVLGIADGAAFAVACDDILKHADEEARHPKNVPLGYLFERVEQKGGHTFRRFYGSPKSWMSAFAPPGKLVRKIHRMDSNGNVTGSLYQRADAR